MKVAILENGEKGCCFCGTPLSFPQDKGISGMSPPCIGEFFVCEECFKQAILQSAAKEGK